MEGAKSQNQVCKKVQTLRVYLKGNKPMEEEGRALQQSVLNISY